MFCIGSIPPFNAHLQSVRASEDSQIVPMFVNRYANWVVPRVTITVANLTPGFGCDAGTNAAKPTCGALLLSLGYTMDFISGTGPMKCIGGSVSIITPLGQ